MTSGNVNPTQTPQAARRTLVVWSIASFVAVLLVIIGVRLVWLSQVVATPPADADLTPPPIEGRQAGADEDRAAVVFDPHADDVDTGVNDNRPIFWTYAQFQLLDKLADGDAPGPAPDRWMIDDQILSSKEVEAYISGHEQAIRQQGGLEFVCYNADYLGGIQGRLESWSPDASSDDWVELNRLPKAVADQFMTGEVFPAPQEKDYQHCRTAVEAWNTLMGV